MHMHVHTYVYTYVHTYVHTYKCTYIHTYKSVCGGKGVHFLEVNPSSYYLLCTNSIRVTLHVQCFKSKYVATLYLQIFEIMFNNK
jgi:hypothetical protein